MRIVIDTNQIVAALVRPPQLATLLMSWESARFTVVASSALIGEYLRVLAYPEVAKLIYPELLRTFHDDFFRYVSTNSRVRTASSFRSALPTPVLDRQGNGYRPQEYR